MALIAGAAIALAGACVGHDFLPGNGETNIIGGNGVLQAGNQINIGNIDRGKVVMIQVGGLALGALGSVSTAPVVATATGIATTAAPLAAAGVCCYAAPKAAHHIKTKNRCVIKDSTVWIWIRPRNKTYIFNVRDGAVNSSVVDGAKLGEWPEGTAANTEQLHTPRPGKCAPEDISIQKAYRRWRGWGDCASLKRVDAVWHGGYSYCVIQVGENCEVKVHPGKVTELDITKMVQEISSRNTHHLYLHPHVGL